MNAWFPGKHDFNPNIMLTEKSRSEWRVQEEPIYRLKQAGLQALSDKELMGILIGDQNLAEELLSTMVV